MAQERRRLFGSCTFSSFLRTFSRPQIHLRSGLWRYVSHVWRSTNGVRDEVHTHWRLTLRAMIDAAPWASTQSADQEQSPVIART